LLDPIDSEDGSHSPPVGQHTLSAVTVPGYTTEDFSLSSVVSQLPLPLPFCSLRIQYSGVAGSMEAQVSSVEQNQNMVVDARAENEGNNWAGSGANPWHLDQNTDSVLFLTNESDQPCPIGFALTAGGVRYYLIKLKLNPHETRAIDMRTLRDAQQADFKGNKIPASATDGGVDWIRLDNLPIMGRMMVIQKGRAMAASYDCVDCCCAASFESLGVSPGDFDLLINGELSLESVGGYEDCDDVFTYYEETDGSSWSSDDSSIIEMVSGTPGEVKGASYGSTTIVAEFEGPWWLCDGGECVHNPNRIIKAYATGNVCNLSVSSPASAQAIGLTGGDYNEAAIPLEATSSCSGTANWTLSFTYAPKSGGPFTASATTSTTINQSANFTTSAGEGGEVKAQASATLAGQPFTASVTFYVLGPSSGIPDSTITSQLLSLYSGATPGLLTGIAMDESSYAQFYDYTEMGFAGLWPEGNAANQYTKADTYVGLMQVPNGMASGFNWLTDTAEGASVFSQKLSAATTYENDERASYPSLPALTGAQLEDVALVYYGGISGVEFYAPNSAGNGWVQTTNSTAINYVNNVRSKIQ
jgi:hypothetical protein